MLIKPDLNRQNAKIYLIYRWMSVFVFCKAFNYLKGLKRLR